MDMLTNYKVADAAKPSDEPMPVEKKSPAKVDDFVSFGDINGQKHTGLVKWIGTDKSVLSDGTTIVGIITVSIMCATKLLIQL